MTASQTKSKDPFVVNVAALLREPGLRRRVEVQGALSELVTQGARVTEDSLVELLVDLEAADPGAIVAIGKVSAPWVGECSRCLRPVGGIVVSDVRELFESRPDSEDIYSLSGDQADLEPLARDAVLLGLPLAPLCAEDCPGLCPACGSDRNEADCGCELTVRDERWAALDVLKQQ